MALTIQFDEAQFVWSQLSRPLAWPKRAKARARHATTSGSGWLLVLLLWGCARAVALRSGLAAAAPGTTLHSHTPRVGDRQPGPSTATSRRRRRNATHRRHWSIQSRRASARRGSGVRWAGERGPLRGGEVPPPPRKKSTQPHPPRTCTRSPCTCGGHWFMTALGYKRPPRTLQLFLTCPAA